METAGGISAIAGLLEERARVSIIRSHTPAVCIDVPETGTGPHFSAIAGLLVERTRLSVIPGHAVAAQVEVAQIRTAGHVPTVAGLLKQRSGLRVSPLIEKRAPSRYLLLAREPRITRRLEFEAHDRLPRGFDLDR